MTQKTTLPKNETTPSQEEGIGSARPSPKIISAIPKKNNKILGLKIASGISLIIFLFWVLTTLIPIAVVEAKYQYKKTLADVFHVDSILEILIPDFDALNLNERSQYREYGIKIPSIFIDEPVVFNVDPNDEKAYTEALKSGIAHASSTAFPDNGGIGYYFAHSSSSGFRVQMNAIFYLLGKLEPNDEIFIWHEGNKYTYRVTETVVTTPDDLSFLQKQDEKESIVLQTCWPPGTTSRRLLVFGERVE